MQNLEPFAMKGEEVFIIYTKEELFNKYFKGLKKGDSVRINVRPDRRSKEGKNTEVSGKIIYINNDFLVVNKKPGGYNVSFPLSDFATGKYEFLGKIYVYSEKDKQAI